MKEATRTLIYAVTAAVAVGGASLTHYWTQPVVTEGFELVGQDFFPEFDDPTLAKSLRVVAYDEDTASVSEFEVQQDASGHWTIPSRNDYPADGEDRLAKTAASIIGIKRGALASRYEADYEKYGVIEPDATDEQKLKGRGQRVTLQDGDGKKLVDYIIGKAVDNPNGHYYIRVPGQKETYISKFDVDLSTKFTDWIEDDLLKIDQSELAEIRVDNYSIDEQQGAILGSETNILKKDGADWKLEGLKDETEELKTDEINTMISTLDNLKIVGVRAKPEGLNADLTVSAKARVDVNRLAAEMASKGFVVARKRDGEGAQIYANEGEVTASTSEGISYTLRFGEIFTGSQSEIEGFSGTAKTPKKDPKETQPGDPANADESDSDTGKSDADADQSDADDKLDNKSSRYVFISAAFDERLLGEKPVKPTEPPTFDASESDAPANDKNGTDAQEPADTKQEEGADAKQEEGDGAKDEESDGAKDEESDGAKDEESDGAKDEESDGAKDEEGDGAKDEAAEDEDKTEESGDDQSEETGEKVKQKKEDSEAAAREAYDAQLRKYESDLKAFDKTVEDGKELAKKLNDRFAKWYYVISAESFEKLRLSREALVKPKEKTDEEAKDEPGKDETSKDAAGKDEPASDAGVNDKTEEAKSKAEPDKDETKKSDSDPPKPADSKNDTPKPDEEDAGTDSSKTNGDDESKKGESSEATEQPETNDDQKPEPAKESPGEEESGESNPDKKPAESETDPPAPKPNP